LGWIVVGPLVAWLITALLYLQGWDSADPPMILMALAVIIQIAFAAYGAREDRGSRLWLLLSALMGAVGGLSLAPVVSSRLARSEGLFDAMHFGGTVWALAGAALAMVITEFALSGRIHASLHP
jgi:hypothetical protein